jgi:exosortase C (VPDSG-CTERM-specific)
MSAVIGPRSRVWAGWRDVPRPERRRLAGLAGYAGLITLLFVRPLGSLFSLALESELHSHIPMVPAIAAYLVYVRPRLHAPAYGTSVRGTSILGLIGFAVLAAGTGLQGRLSANDHVLLMTLAYLSFVGAGLFLFLGARWMRGAAFPVSFLLFMVPLPDNVVYWLETASVLASADVTAILFDLTGTPFVRSGTVFALPGIVFEVAQECSGIRSSWVLLITSVLASHLFLSSPWRRMVLVMFVIPLAIVRNAFRILVIGLLCVHIGPHMIDSVIHRRGGPIFFALSLVPLFLMLMWLRRAEPRSKLRG